MSTKRLKKVDLRTTYLVYGYNRNHSQDIPTPICDLCLLYYFQPDAWSKRLIHSDIQLSDQNTTIKRITKTTKSSNANAFLIDTIESGVHIKLFEIMSWDQFKSKMDIGICEVKYRHPPLQGYFAEDIQEKFCVSFARDQLKTGAKVQIIINFDQNKFISKVNGRDYQKKTIKRSKYRVYVGMHISGDSIKFIE